MTPWSRSTCSPRQDGSRSPTTTTPVSAPTPSRSSRCRTATSRRRRTRSSGSRPTCPSDLRLTDQEPRTTMLTIDGVSRRFGGVYANQDVTLDVAEGELRGIIGPNGAGKSTLFNLIAGHIRPEQRDDQPRGPEDRSAAGARTGASGHRHRVPGRPGLPRHEPAGERHGGRALPHARRRRGGGAASAVAAPRGARDQVDAPRSALERVGLARLGHRGRPRVSRSASNGGSRWPARWRASPRCCCWTSRPPACAPHERQELAGLIERAAARRHHDPAGRARRRPGDLARRHGSPSSTSAG